MPYPSDTWLLPHFSWLLRPLQNKFSKGSTKDKTINDDTDVVDNEDKMVAVEDVVTVKTQNNFNDSKISLHFRKDCGIFCEGEWNK